VRRENILLRCRDASGARPRYAVCPARTGWRQRALPTRISALMLRVNTFFQKLLAKSNAHH